MPPLVLNPCFPVVGVGEDILGGGVWGRCLFGIDEPDRQFEMQHEFDNDDWYDHEKFLTRKYHSRG